MNDITNRLASSSLLFADDAVIYRPIKSPSDEYALQSDLTQLERWSQTNAMKLNTCKTKVLHMTRSRKQTPLPLYLLNGSLLSTATTYKYLGITINNTLTWNDHVDAVISKANRTLGFIYGKWPEEHQLQP